MSTQTLLHKQDVYVHINQHKSRKLHPQPPKPYKKKNKHQTSIYHPTKVVALVKMESSITILLSYFRPCLHDKKLWIKQQSMEGWDEKDMCLLCG